LNQKKFGLNQLAVKTAKENEDLLIFRETITKMNFENEKKLRIDY